MSELQHTPLPWGLNGYEGAVGTEDENTFHCEGISGADGRLMVALPNDPNKGEFIFPDKRDANFFLEAVNSYPTLARKNSQLRSALEEICYDSNGRWFIGYQVYSDVTDLIGPLLSQHPQEAAQKTGPTREELVEFASGVRFLLRMLRDMGAFDTVAATDNCDPSKLILKTGEILTALAREAQEGEQ